MDRLLKFLFGTYFRRGNLTFITSRGTHLNFGDRSGTPVTLRLTTPAAERALVLDPELKFGELYMDGGLVVEQGTIADALEIALGQSIESPKWAKLQWLLRFIRRRFQQFNPRRRSRNNVAHHYDLDGQLYSLFLDADRQYSCAYFENSEQTLDDAQLAKKRHLAAKLLLAPHSRVLDIGCGWGGLGLYLAEMAGAHVTGVTLSQEQHGIAQGRAAERDLADRAQFRLQDYRDVKEKFDRIVSVGMFEHVGINHYDAFFKKCAELLDDYGVMVLHSIGRSEGPGITNPWIAKYIFP
ncbi:MAG: class I SAM-dependent methyltransferase, partial [Pseudolabrys sp.]|nr:class I SAM-dependent methyltransferase [Pseudolabrys sp.]